MIRLTILLLLGCMQALAQTPAVGHKAAPEDPVAVARSFLPPHSRMATLYTFNYRTLKFGPDLPAVVQAHVVRPTSEDVVFAYYSPRADTMNKTLFLDLLEKWPGGYEKMYEFSYRPQTLFVPRAIRVLHLDGVSTDAVAVVHGIGADLGGRLDVLIWREPWGWGDVFPPNGSTHYFYFFPRKTGLDVALSASKHPGLSVSPAPEWFHWTGRRFTKIPAPPGSSKWPLPD